MRHGSSAQRSSGLRRIQPDGKLVAVGWTGNPVRLALIRYKRAGTLDASFGRGGRVLTSLQFQNDRGDWGAAIQPNGMIVVGSGGVISRYSSNGTPDPTFGRRGGKVTVASSIGAVAVQADGKIVAAGFETVPKYGDHTDFALTRLLTNGRLDASFGSNGTVLTDFAPTYEAAAATALVIQRDGMLTAAGYAGRIERLDIVNSPVRPRPLHLGRASRYELRPSGEGHDRFRLR